MQAYVDLYAYPKDHTPYIGCGRTVKKILYMANFISFSIF